MSPTTLWQAFGKVGWQNDRTDLDLSYTYADTRLFGNGAAPLRDRKSTRLNSSHSQISYAVFCLKKKNSPYRMLKKITAKPVNTTFDCVLPDIRTESDRNA